MTTTQSLCATTVAALLLASPFIAKADTVIVTTSGGVGADTYTGNGSNGTDPNTNYGTAPTIEVGQQQYAGLSEDGFFRFDFGGADASAASNATLTLNVEGVTNSANSYTSNSTNWTLYAITGGSPASGGSGEYFGETSLTWNTQSAGTYTALQTITIPGSDAYTSTFVFNAASIDTFLQSQSAAGLGFASFALVQTSNATGDGGHYSFYSNNSDDSSLYPTLSFDTAAVPEPSTYVMMLAGLGLLVVIQRRRRA